MPEIARRGLTWRALPHDEVRDFVACIENQEAVRSQLDDLGLVAFVGNGAILPRESGASDRPMHASDVVPFTSPPSLEVRIAVPNAAVQSVGTAQKPASAPATR